MNAAEKKGMMKGYKYLMECVDAAAAGKPVPTGNAKNPKEGFTKCHYSYLECCSCVVAVGNHMRRAYKIKDSGATNSRISPAFTRIQCLS
ncbi:MAG: hypothetical protein M1819_004696 [Sarea resinae]|nr:MAG: hypothetical protein M1819_004696 [Sarea resinae]